MAADPFPLLNRVLDSRHTQPGAIRKACMAVEDCIVNNRCLPQRGTALAACMAICTAKRAACLCLGSRGATWTACIAICAAATVLASEQSNQPHHRQQGADAVPAFVPPPLFRDNLRGFFDKCFPNLLKRIFGYDDFEASWLNMVTKVGAHQQNAFRESRL